MTKSAIVECTKLVNKLISETGLLIEIANYPEEIDEDGYVQYLISTIGHSCYTCDFAMLADPKDYKTATYYVLGEKFNTWEDAVKEVIYQLDRHCEC